MDLERALEPTEEKPQFVCDGCGDVLLSGARVRQELLYGDVVGCGECTEWEQPGPGGPEVCPNCGSWLCEAERVLVTVNGVALACGECVANRFAAEVCKCQEEDELERE